MTAWPSTRARQVLAALERLEDETAIGLAPDAGTAGLARFRFRLSRPGGNRAANAGAHREAHGIEAGEPLTV